MTRRIAAAVLFVVVAVAALAPIRSYDYFWHLAAGRWIVEHHAIPVTDPLAVASAKTPWINGEWLYEVALYATHAGDVATSVLNALLIAAIFAAAYLFASRQNDWTIALVAAATAFAGASDRLGVRPSTAAALLLVIALGLLSSRLPQPWLEIAYAALAVIWINVHPSALLAPLLALLFLRWKPAVAGAVALLINPYGWNAIRAPVELSALVGSGEFLNAEWLPSDPRLFPLLYATGATVLIALVAAREKRASLWRFGVFALLFFLAARHVRNQGLYFAALPLLLPPMRVRRDAIAAAAILPLGWALVYGAHGVGVDDERFPMRAVAKLKASGLPGNIYNADQFGGLLEWTFYPAPRALTDGRNELYRQFIAEDARARQDDRVWHALVAKYGAALAVDEYGKIVVEHPVTHERTLMPVSLTRYRRSEWALIAFDDAAMVFARRAAFPRERIAALEYRYLVPDDPSRRYPNERILAAAREEIVRARREFGDIRVVRELEEGATN